VIGSTVLLGGVAMLVLPGPGLLVIVLALAILATEFAWARHLLKRVRREIKTRTGFGPDPDAASEPKRAAQGTRE
jgi:tellurite resistance protein TerC